MTQVSIIDYGVGNLFSMKTALQKTGVSVEIVKTPNEILNSDGVILPGVGNFGAASVKLSPLAMAIRKTVANGTYILGSCLGLQLLFQRSEEGHGEGLGLMKGWIRAFSGDLKTPHMGWNTIKASRTSPILEGIPDGSYFYFVHSFYPDPENSENILAKTTYGHPFTSMVEKRNIYGTQFHPEKSGKIGSTLLQNFIRLLRR
jgi:glutamine amidotransferase